MAEFVKDTLRHTWLVLLLLHFYRTDHKLNAFHFFAITKFRFCFYHK
jgi:hypothetical protein